MGSKKSYTLTNTLAYYATKFISAMRSFMIQARLLVPAGSGFESLNVGLLVICSYSYATANNPMFKGTNLSPAGTRDLYDKTH